MHRLLTIALIFASLQLTAQTTSDFENFNLPSESFLNGSDGNGGFSNGNIFLPNFYDDSFASWTGWSISNTTNTTNITLEGMAEGEKVSGFYLTNSTYAYLSMKEGDFFAKRFGGVTGSDPDYFLLAIKKYENGELSTESVDVYLADYRFEDNAEDYILNEWIYVDLTVLGEVDSLQFSLTSSDTGAVGMNTPAYFCIDNFRTLDGITTVENLGLEGKLIVYPNPASEMIFVENDLEGMMKYQIFDKFGREMKIGSFEKEEGINIDFLSKGMYFLRIEKEDIFRMQVFVKQ